MAIWDGLSETDGSFSLNSLEVVLDGRLYPGLALGDNRRSFHILSELSRKRLSHILFYEVILESTLIETEIWICVRRYFPTYLKSVLPQRSQRADVQLFVGVRPGVADLQMISLF